MLNSVTKQFLLLLIQRILAPDIAIQRRREMEDRLATASHFVQVRERHEMGSTSSMSLCIADCSGCTPSTGMWCIFTSISI